MLRTPYDILDTAINRHMKDDIRGKYSRFYYVLCEYIGIKYVSHSMCAHRDVTRPNQLGHNLITRYSAEYGMSLKHYDIAKPAL